MDKIDRESERRFSLAYNELNAKFQEVFAKLFPNGEAKLTLTNRDNLLETGVEIMVRPGGKKFQSVNLLSGGEKTLAALALILSAFFVKPAPFLLFDEVDAPLDEANTVQFTELLKQAAQTSQVMIITHNKKTMEISDALIGITSSDGGVSKVVSVELTITNTG